MQYQTAILDKHNNSAECKILASIYLAGSGSVLEKTKHIGRLLESRLPCQVFIPQDLVPSGLKDQERPETIFHICKQLMDRSDIVIVNMENYGRDTASEIGYCNATGKTIIGFVENGHCREDFMVSGFLHYFASEVEELVEMIAEQTGMIPYSPEVQSDP